MLAVLIPFKNLSQHANFFLIHKSEYTNENKSSPTYLLTNNSMQLYPVSRPFQDLGFTDNKHVLYISGRNIQ